jgi:hypothetical protein
MMSPLPLFTPVLQQFSQPISPIRRGKKKEKRRRKRSRKQLSSTTIISTKNMSLLKSENILPGTMSSSIQNKIGSMNNIDQNAMNHTIKTSFTSTATTTTTNITDKNNRTPASEETKMIPHLQHTTQPTRPKTKKNTNRKKTPRDRGRRRNKLKERQKAQTVVTGPITTMINGRKQVYDQNSVTLSDLGRLGKDFPRLRFYEALQTKHYSRVVLLSDLVSAGENLTKEDRLKYGVAVNNTLNDEVGTIEIETFTPETETNVNIDVSDSKNEHEKNI